MGAVRGLLVLLALCVAALALPAVASAARPGTLVATGEAPSIAVDATGTGYVAYNDQPPGQNDQPVGLCVVRPGTARCASNRDVLIDGNSGEAQPALISATGDGQLVLASGRCCGNDDVVMLSSNGGATFTAPETIGGLIYFDGAIGPGAHVLFDQANSLDGTLAQEGSPGNPADLTATLVNPATGLSAPAAWSGNKPVVVSSGNETVASIYSGSGDPNDGANWNNVRVPGSTFHPSMASGPAGVFLLQDTGTFNGRLTVRRFEGNGFGPAHVIVNFHGSQGTALAEDAAGHLVAMWYDNNGTIWAAASREDGVRWTRPHAIATDVQLPSRLSAALGPDGRGWLVYDLNAGSEVRLVPVSADGLLGIKAPAPRPKPHRHHRRHHKPHRHRATHHPKKKHHPKKRHHRRRHRPARKRHATLVARSFPGSGAGPDRTPRAALGA